MSTALAKRDEQARAIKDMLDKAKGSIAAVAARHMTPERLLKIGLAATQRQPLLLECSPRSIVRAVVGCAELGLEPNALGHAYLVPFKNQGQYEAQLIVGYRGLLQLAYRSGLIESIAAECVFEGDDFDFDNGTSFIRHKSGEETEPSKITHAYCIVTMKGGARLIKVMHRKQIDRVRARSRASDSGPWKTDYEEMARKTVLRNLLKYAPMSIEMQKAEAVDIHADTGDVTALGDLEWVDVADQEPEEPSKGTAALKNKVAAPPALIEDHDDPNKRPRDGDEVSE